MADETERLEETEPELVNVSWDLVGFAAPHVIKVSFGEVRVGGDEVAVQAVRICVAYSSFEDVLVLFAAE